MNSRTEFSRRSFPSAAFRCSDFAASGQSPLRLSHAHCGTSDMADAKGVPQNSKLEWTGAVIEKINETNDLSVSNRVVPN